MTIRWVWNHEVQELHLLLACYTMQNRSMAAEVPPTALLTTRELEVPWSQR